MDEIKEAERRVEIRKAHNEELNEELSEAEKKAMIKRLKREEGKDWKHLLGGIGNSMKINKETLQTLHSMGSGGENLRQLSMPTSLRKYK